jgi:hypothetical protein
MNVEYTKSELKKSLSIVSDYLFTSLLSHQPGTKIRLGSIGYLVKKTRRITNGNLGQGTFYYYHCGFKKSRPLKRALDEQIVDE